jgi:hypothetical protein
VDISHGCYSGPLAQFDNLRLMWAQTAGYGVTDYRDMGGPVMPNIDYDAFKEEDLLGEWPDGAPDDPLMILLVHTEGEGRIKVTHCPYLADRLEELEGKMMAGGAMVTPAWVLLTQQFVRGLRTAAAYNQDVVFT